MRLRVVRCRDLKKKVEIKTATRYALDQLLSSKKEILQDLSITIELNNIKANKAKSWGYCQCSDNVKAPRKFLIVMHKNISKRNFYEVLMHELVHLKQYATEELTDCDEKFVKWKKRLYNWNIYDTVHIMCIPWEKEAYVVGEKLYNKYLTEVI